MRKIISILVLSLMYFSSASSEEINLICKPLTGKPSPVSLSINTENEMAIWQGGKPMPYFLDNGIFKYSISSKDNITKLRHSLNRYTGILKVELYKFDDEKKEQFTLKVTDELNKAGKTIGDTAFFFKTYHEKLGDFESNFELNFDCETSKKKF